MVLIKTVNNFLLPVCQNHLHLSPTCGVSLGWSLEDTPTLRLVLDVDHSVCAQLAGLSNTFRNLHSEH